MHISVNKCMASSRNLNLPNEKTSSVCFRLLFQDVNDTLYDLKGIFLGLWGKFKCNIHSVIWTEVDYLRGELGRRWSQLCYKVLISMLWTGRGGVLEGEKRR